MLSSSFLAITVFVQSLLSAGPTIKLDRGTFTGTAKGRVESYLGIPYAQPPVGDLRFRLPVANTPYAGSFAASNFGPSCPQQATGLPNTDGLPGQTTKFLRDSIFGETLVDSEDCLTVNIFRPTTATADSKLPVVVWIHGGAFEQGGSSTYGGDSIVSRSISLQQPVIYVSMNYRLTAFGFLAGKEVKDAKVGNLGLQDQRQALRWVQKYISQFGGDPTKVTIWGESAGATSVGLHMVANKGDTEGLFRAAFMQSGAPPPVGDIANSQKYYDFLVKDTGCSSTSNTLACLRAVPYPKLKASIDKSPNVFSFQSLNQAWMPRADGVFITDAPQKLVQQGTVANIPYIIGNCDDEGTLFSLSTRNLTTSADFINWASNTFLSGVPSDTMQIVAKYYSAEPFRGSPFDTGLQNALTPQFKRIAAFQGDFVFQAPRRWLLENTLSNNPNVWAFLSKREKSMPMLGSAQTSDLVNSYGEGEIRDFLIRFASTLNPNSATGFQWPNYNLKTRRLLTFTDSVIFPMTVTGDEYRQDDMKLLSEVSLAYPF